MLLRYFFGFIEGIFFISSVVKFFHGGFVAVGLALVILFVMAVWEKSNQIQASVVEEVELADYIPQLAALKADESIPMTQTNVVFMVPNLDEGRIGRAFMYSILDKHPKRAKVYWFVTVEVTDEPYRREFTIDMLETDFIVKVKFYLGFRESQDVNVYLRQIIHDLMKAGRLPKQPQKYTITPGREVGDFRFILIQEELSNVTELSKWDRQILQLKLAIKRHATSPETWFGLSYSDVSYETVPLIIGPTRKTALKERRD